MKQYFYILVLTLGLWSCNSQTEKSDDRNSLDSFKTTNSSQLNTNNKFYKTDCDNFEINKNFMVLPYLEMLRVFNETCLVYCSPIETSKIIDTLKFNSEVRLIEAIKIDNSEWFRISNNEKSLFVKKDYLTLKPYDYSGYLIGYNLADKNRTIELKSIANDNSSEEVSNYSLLENYSTYKIENLPYNGLDKSGLIIKYTTVHSLDPTSYYYEFVIFNQDKKTFKKLITYSSTHIDLCESDEEIFYFPMKFENGKILLVKDADYEHIFNYQTAELNVLEYPKQTDIPIGQIIVKINKKTECITDNEGYQIIDPKTKNPKMKITQEKPIYYLWDGQNLTKK